MYMYVLWYKLLAIVTWVHVYCIFVFSDLFSAYTEVQVYFHIKIPNSLVRIESNVCSTKSFFKNSYDEVYFEYTYIRMV
jgi:hypothetical protein